MIDVAQDETYAPGDTIRAVLRFRWDGEFEAVTVELLAQVEDVKVHHVAVDVLVSGPDRVEQYGAGEDLFRALDEGGKQRELLGAQVHLLFSAPRDVTSGIEAYVSGPKDRIGLLFLPQPPRESAHAGKQFGDSKGVR
jgi:hypothetical protein